VKAQAARYPGRFRKGVVKVVALDRFQHSSNAPRYTGTDGEVTSSCLLGVMRRCVAL